MPSKTKTESEYVTPTYVATALTQSAATESVNALRQQAANVTAASDAVTRKGVRDTLAAWSAVGYIAERIYVVSGNPGSDITWAAIKKVVFTADTPTLGDWSERDVSRCWDAHRANAVAKYSDWLPLCDDDAVTKDSDSYFNPRAASSCVAWSLAKHQGKTDASGRITVRGNRGKNSKMTLAARKAANVKARAKAAKTADALVASDDQSAPIVSIVSPQVLRDMSDDALDTLEQVIAAERRRRKAAKKNGSTADAASDDSDESIDDSDAADDADDAVEDIQAIVAAAVATALAAAKK